MLKILWIALGGALGTLARYGLSVWCQARLGATFPFGTMAVNVLGSFLLGLLMAISLASDVISPTMRLALGTGVMGGFTTYSTFNYETLKLFEERAWLLGTANVLGTVIGCFVAGLLGLGAGRKLASG